MTKQQIQTELTEIKQLLSTQADKPLNFDEAAKYLNITKSYLYKLCCWKQISYFKPGGKKNFFKKSDLDNWLFRNKVKSNSQLEEEARNNSKGQ